MNSMWVSLSALSSFLLSSIAVAGVLPNVQKDSPWFADGQQSVITKTKLTPRNKAKNVYALSQKLIDLHNSEVPQDRDALMALPGVGRKTANVVLNIGFGEARFAVDTHVFRLGNRTGIAPGKNELEVEKKLDRRVPDPYRINAHHWLILHGRYVCKARKPDCPNCVVQDLCRYKDKTKA